MRQFASYSKKRPNFHLSYSFRIVIFWDGITWKISNGLINPHSVPFVGQGSYLENKNKMLVILLSALLVGGAFSFKANFNHGLQGITTTKPLVIAHRGASGVYPEHTIPAYQVRQATAICDIYSHSKNHGINLKALKVTNPGFPRGERQPLGRFANLLLGKIFAQNCIKMKEFG